MIVNSFAAGWINWNKSALPALSTFTAYRTVRATRLASITSINAIAVGLRLAHERHKPAHMISIVSIIAMAVNSRPSEIIGTPIPAHLIYFRIPNTVKRKINHKFYVMNKQVTLKYFSQAFLKGKKIGYRRTDTRHPSPWSPLHSTNLKKPPITPVTAITAIPTKQRKVPITGVTAVTIITFFPTIPTKRRKVPITHVTPVTFFAVMNGILLSAFRLSAYR